MTSKTSDELAAAVRAALAGQRTPSMTLTEAAARFRVSPRTLRRWVASGQLTGYKIGPRLIRVVPEDVAALQRRMPGASA